MRRHRGTLSVLALAGLLAWLLWGVHPLLAAAPLVALGLPAALMLQATIRHGDPYDVLYKYRRSVTPPE